MDGNWTSEKIERFSNQVDEAALHNRDQSLSWQRWVMAASLSINGGATIAVLNLSAIDGSSRIWAIGWFVAGLLSAIGFGIVASIQMSKYSGFYKTQGWNVRNLTDTSEGSNKSEIDLETFDKLLKREKNIFWIQFFGLICFLVGIGVAVEGIK